MTVDDENALDEVLASYLDDLDRGCVVDESKLYAQHPALAAALQSYFAGQRDLQERLRDLNEDSTYADKPRQLAVRCPHCCDMNSVDANSTLNDLVCSTCGSRFRLVDSSAETIDSIASLRVGRFRLIEKLGAGAFGSVWKARDESLDRFVAVKIPIRGGMSPEEQAKFFREARAAAQLRHPNIVSVYEVGRDCDTIYIVSDFIQGVSLADWLTGQQMTGRDAAQLIAKLAGALHAAHERGVIHRDLKPANVLIDRDGEPHVTDFGLARRDAGEVTMTMDGQVLGTPAYMAPEQAAGQAHEADRRSDVYSLGVILFQLLTGELPFRGNPRMLLHQVINDEPPSPRKFNANVGRDLETVSLKCLQKSPFRRYQSAAELGEDLNRFLTGRHVLARPIGRVERAWRWSQRNRAVTIGAGAIAIALIAATAISMSAYLFVSAEKRNTKAALDRESTARQATTTALEASKAATAQSEAVLAFLTDDLFGGYESHPEETQTQTVAALLKRAESKIPASFKAQPLIEAKLHLALAKIFSGQGQGVDAVPHIERAVEIFERELGPEDLTTLDARGLELLIVPPTNSRSSRATKAKLESFIDALKRVSPNSELLPRLLLNAAEGTINHGDLGRGQDYLAQAEATIAKKYGAKRQSLNKDLDLAKANLYFRSARFPEAEEIYRKHAKASHFQTADAYNLARVQRRQGKHSEALNSIEQYYTWLVKSGEIESPDCCELAEFYADALAEMGRFYEAATTIERLIPPLQRRGHATTVGAGILEPPVGALYSKAAGHYRKAGDLVAAKRCLQEAHDVYAALTDDFSRRRFVVGPLLMLAEVLIDQNDYVPALDVLTELRELQPINSASALAWGIALFRTGHERDAIAWFSRARSLRLGRVAIDGLSQGARQTGVTPPGVIGFEWHRLKMDVQSLNSNAPTATLFLDDLEIGSVATNGLAKGGHITIGYMDQFAGVSSAPEFSFAVVDNLKVSGSLRFEDDFEDDKSTDYFVASTSDDVLAEDRYDYARMGLPPSTNSKPGDRYGLKLAANQKQPEAPEAVTLHLKKTCNGNYSVECDIWINYPGPAGNPGPGATEFVTLGVCADGKTPNGGRGDPGSGVWAAVDGDGGIQRDFKIFVGSDERLHFESAIGGDTPWRWAACQNEYFAGAGSPARELLYLALAYDSLGDSVPSRQNLELAEDYLRENPEDLPDVSDLLKETRDQLANSSEVIRFRQ